MSATRVVTALAAMVVGAALSLALLLHHYGEGAGAFCGAGGGCDVVSRSAYASIGGVPLAALGLAFGLALGAWLLVALALPAPLRDPMTGLALAALVAALVVDVALLGVQAFLIGAFCPLCLGTYAANAVAAAALWPARRAASLAALRAEATGRTALVGASLAGLAFAASAGSLTLALAEREALREATLLGSQRAERLEQALDDPAEFEAYQQRRSIEEFDEAPALPVDYGGVPSKGATDAAVRVVEYSDFLCPYCRSLAGALDRYLPASGGLVSLHFKHFPLDPECNPSVQGTGHAGACALARGAICADAQGGFWQFHDAVFAAQDDRPGVDALPRLARAAGIDLDALLACVDAEATHARLRDDVEEGRSFGVTSTPTVLVNGRKLRRLNDFARVVEHEAERLGVPHSH